MININGKTDVYGVIGNPIKHTMSPYIQNMLAQEMNKNVVYIPFHVKEGQIVNAINGLNGLNIKGINVTVPYKVDVITFLDEIEEQAKKIGAVNTIKLKEGKLFGFNTDAQGLEMACNNNNIKIKNKVVCILGAGGAAKAVAVLCADNEPKKLIIVNRTLEKALEIKDTLLKDYNNLSIEVLSYDKLEQNTDVQVVFQTTSIGLPPNTNQCVIKDSVFFKNVEAAVDLIYNPKETKFLKMAKEGNENIIIMNGLEMLYFQAVRAFEIWHEVKIPEETIKKCMIEVYNKVYNS